MSIGEFLAKAVEWIRQLWPLIVIAPWERGLRVTAGRAGKSDLQPGVRWFLPLLGEIHTEEVNIAGFTTPTQTIDGHSFSLGVRYRVHDVRAYYLKIHDAEETLQTTVMIAAAACREEDPDAWADQVQSAVRGKMRGWGVEVLDVVPVTATESPALRILGAPWEE